MGKTAWAERGEDEKAGSLGNRENGDPASKVTRRPVLKGWGGGLSGVQTGKVLVNNIKNIDGGGAAKGGMVRRRADKEMGGGDKVRCRERVSAWCRGAMSNIGLSEGRKKIRSGTHVFRTGRVKSEGRHMGASEKSGRKWAN